MNQYWLNVGGEITGPFGEEELRRLYFSPGFSPSAKLCHVGSEQWFSASSVLDTRPIAHVPRPTNEGVGNRRQFGWRGVVAAGLLVIIIVAVVRACQAWKIGLEKALP